MYNSIWYNNLNKPFLSPPNYIFKPVWGVLYILIFSALLVYIFKPSEKNKIAGYIYFVMQLLLNIIWSPAFFFLQKIGLALVIIIFLDIFTALTVKSFYSVSKAAGILLIPYLIWILFATYLNFVYLILNP